ncbi:MAG: hypothetical protein ABIA74_01775 [bacterium]
MKSQKILKLLFQIIFITQTCYSMQLLHRADMPSVWEQNYINKRLQKEKESIKIFTGKNNAEYSSLPKIALVGSGGGMRAHIAFLGTMLGLQEIGLLDGIRYASVLSGSTWMLGTFLTKVIMDETPDLNKFAQYVQARANEGLLDGDDVKVSDDMLSKISAKILNREKIQPSDIWGMVVMHRLMSDLHGAELDITFKEIRNLLNLTTFFPFPIFNAAITNEGVGNYKWLEVNPYTTGSPHLGAFVQTNFFESKFRNGELKNGYPESSLAEWLGLFGSAYCVTSQDAAGHTSISALDLVNSILKKLDKLPFVDPSQHRFLEAKMNNFTYRLNTTLGKAETLELVDAGMAFNLPFPPLFNLNRNIDVFIVCDASADNGQLNHVINYAIENNIPFPTKSTKYEIDIDSETLTFEVLKENGTPTVIYFKNPIEHSTIDFTYSKQEFLHLSCVMQTMVEKAKNVIRMEIRNKVGNVQESSWINDEVEQVEIPYIENTSQPNIVARSGSRIAKLFSKIGCC